MLEECERANQGQPITFFEITTAAAFLAFTREPADYVLLEVGLGGRFDATNVVANPAVTAITPISLDHQQFLGETIAKIAFEKAGILRVGHAGRDRAAKRGRARRSSPRTQMRSARRSIVPAREWKATARRDHCFAYRGRSRFVLPRPGLLGPHQYANAGTALACLECLPGFTPSLATLSRGITRVEWPARLQHLTEGKLARLMPAGGELVARWRPQRCRRRSAGRSGQSWRDKKLNLVFGMLKTHDAEGFLAALKPYAARVEALTIPGEENARSADDIARYRQEHRHPRGIAAQHRRGGRGARPSPAGAC